MKDQYDIYSFRARVPDCFVGPYAANVHLVTISILILVRNMSSIRKAKYIGIFVTILHS